jgi:hypothetical protein
MNRMPDRARDGAAHVTDPSLGPLGVPQHSRSPSLRNSFEPRHLVAAISALEGNQGSARPRKA